MLFGCIGAMGLKFVGDVDDSSEPWVGDGDGDFERDSLKQGRC